MSVEPGSDALQRMRALLQRPGRQLLGICGEPGAGKSTLDNTDEPNARLVAASRHRADHVVAWD